MPATKAVPASAETPLPTNVVAALARVMAELPGIGRKEKSNQGYNYRGIEAITAEAGPLLGKYGVVFVPRVVERRTTEFTLGGKPWTEDHATIIYTVYGPGGIEDRIEVGPLIALGRDNSDKGMNKCMTQAYKYALLQVLCIGDSKDDADAHVAAEADAPPEVNWYKENGWKSALAHDEARAEFAALIAGLPEPSRLGFRKWFEDQGQPWKAPWPRAFADLVGKKAAEFAATPPGSPEKAPSEAKGAKGAPSAPEPAPGPLCAWCQEPESQDAGELTDEDEGPGRMHAECRVEWEADQP